MISVISALVQVYENKYERQTFNDPTEMFTIQYSEETYPQPDQLLFEIKKQLELYLSKQDPKRLEQKRIPKVRVALWGNGIVGHFFESPHAPHDTKKGRTFIITLDYLS